MTEDPYKPTPQLRFIIREREAILQQLWELPADFGPTRLFQTQWRDVPLNQPETE